MLKRYLVGVSFKASKNDNSLLTEKKKRKIFEK